VREWVCINGQLLSADQACISVFDSGFMQGVGLFETLRAYRGRVFRLQLHLDRLAQSARTLGWGLVPDSAAMSDCIEQVVGATEADEVRVRLTVTTGSLRVSDSEPPALTLVATASAGARYPVELYANGVTLVVSRYRQSAADPTIGHKTTSYFARLASLREAHAVGAFESLWLTPDERVAEGAISSLFAVRDETLLTPPLDTPVLPGITRAAVIELSAGLRIPVREQALRLQDLLAADELFLTNSLMQLMPVVRIGREAIGTEKPGDVTRRLAEAYDQRVVRETARA
jgi:branched-chain amino acid aminotransferase